MQERVRTGAIQLRKVNGLVNPADLFTKHLNSRDRVNQLVELFNCEYREGRSESAPLLRKDKVPKAECNLAASDFDETPSNAGRARRTHNGNGRDSNGRDSNMTHSNMAGSNMASSNIANIGDEHVNNLSPSHDPHVLPHDYADSDMAASFPIAEAPEDLEGIPADVCICCKPGCTRCHPSASRCGAEAAVRGESW